ncbi:MAG: hypothetical protein R3350_04760, partial [Saprospiraceae bacterium]|nr:hypothetical protein [Saprospiraceae bacterium]
MRQILIPIQFVLPILACLYLAAPLSAQELRENERGEKIIVYPDGSWQYFNRFPAQDDRALTDRPEKYPVYEGKVESRRDPFQATETDARKIAERKAQLARQALEIADERARQATAQRQELEKRLDEADRSASLEKKVEVARQAEDQAMKEMNLAREEAREAELLVSRGDYLTPGRSNAGSSSTANPAASNFEESLAGLDAGKPAGPTA